MVSAGLEKKVIKKVELIWEGDLTKELVYVVKEKTANLPGVIQVYDFNPLGRQILNGMVPNAEIIELQEEKEDIPLDDEMIKKEFHDDRERCVIMQEYEQVEDEVQSGENINLKEFKLFRNSFLNHTTKGYYMLDYKGSDDVNTKFILDFKNTFHNTHICCLINVKEQAKEIAKEVIPLIIKNESWKDCVCVSVPRARKLDNYFPEQLYLQYSIQEAVDSLNREGLQITDGTACIKRIFNTKTTHFVNKPDIEIETKGGREINDGPRPYPGITKETCLVNEELIKGRNVILIDDIYTARVNIDEDCIQALYEKGAKKVVFFAFAKTKKERW